MDDSEKLVERFLIHRGHTNIVYEPDGNVPPDFLVDGKIAIEVRRLNQNHNDGIATKGLEETAIPLWNQISKMALSLGKPTSGVSWYLFFRFSRPINWDTLKPKVLAELKSFINQPLHQKTTFDFGNDFQIEVFPSHNQYATFYVMGGRSDEQSGGWLIEEIAKNLQHCINEKTNKISKFKSKYPQWWLVLPDHIGHGLDDFDQSLFRDQVSLSHTWDKIILVNPLDPTRAFEI